MDGDSLLLTNRNYWRVLASSAFHKQAELNNKIRNVYMKIENLRTSHSFVMSATAWATTDSLLNKSPPYHWAITYLLVVRAGSYQATIGSEELWYAKKQL